MIPRDPARRSNPIPIRVDDAWYLTNLRRDQRQLLRREPEKVNLYVERIVRPEFSDDSARNDIEILKTLDDPSERARISVCDDT
jgi:hypothetical protein